MQRQIFYVKGSFFSFFCFLLIGVRNIFNQFFIIIKIDREYLDMRNYVKQRGWWDGKEEFDFIAVYFYIDTVVMMILLSRYCQGYKFLDKYRGKVSM